MGLPATIISAMDTLLRSPPDTPRIKSLPTFVLYVWLSPKMAMTTRAMYWDDSLRDMSRIRSEGVRQEAANSSVCPTRR